MAFPFALDGTAIAQPAVTRSGLDATRAAERQGRSSVVVAMLRAFASLLLIVGSPALAQQPVTASAAVTQHARTIFERDWVLMNWALKFYDRDRDILLGPSEAEAAAQAFRAMADADRDGRVTTQEYRAARAFILARY